MWHFCDTISDTFLNTGTLCYIQKFGLLKALRRLLRCSHCVMLPSGLRLRFGSNVLTCHYALPFNPKKARYKLDIISISKNILSMENN